MKKSVLAISAILSLSMAHAQAPAAPAPVATQPLASALTDVPAGHWAKDFIDRLIGKGIILGYPDGTFRGTQNLTRYEAAAMIARLLDDIRSDPKLMGSLGSEDLKSLQNAIQELAADLAALGVRVSDVEENSVSKEDFARLETRIEELGKMEGSGDAQALESIKKQIEELNARVEAASQAGEGVSTEQLEELRLQVEDNANSITALNDLTILLNQDILDLQDRVSAIDAARADYVQRGDLASLTGRVTEVDAKIDKVNADLGARLTKLEKDSFSVKPTLSIGYSVSRANRNFDIDRLFPLNADGTVAANAFTSGGIDSDTGAERRDYGDFGGDSSAVLSGADGLFGFATKTGPVYQEGNTTISFGLTFGNSGKFTEVKSQSSGSLFSTKGGFQVNKVSVDFGLVSSLPSSAYIDTNGDGSKQDTETAGRVQYPGSGGVAIRDGDGYFYSPIFFKFKNATAEFSVGNNPITVTLGKTMKFYFADYAFDNDYRGRGDGYKVEVDGRSLPVLGSFSPRLMGVYGSRNGRTFDGAANIGYGVYYRGLKAEIAPAGRLVAGIFYAQEGLDDFGRAANKQVPNDVTLYGADLHGNLFGANIHSEFVSSTQTALDASKTTATAFYGRIARRNYIVTGRKADGSTGELTKTHDSPAGYELSEQNKKDGFVEVVSYALDTSKDFDLNAAGFGIKTDLLGLTIHDLNYRRIDKGFNAVTGLSHDGYGTGNSVLTGARQNLAFSTSSKSVTAPFANLRLITTDADGKAVAGEFIGQQGFGAKLSTNIGPVALGGYYDSSTGVDGNADTAMTEMGVAAKATVGLFGLRGNYNTLDSKRPQNFSGKVAPVSVSRYAVHADVNPGWGLYVGGHYRSVSVDGAQSSTDRGLFSRGYLISHYRGGNDQTFTTGTGCADRGFGTAVTTDIDGVNNVLNPKVSLETSSSSTCFTSYGVELGHNGKDAAALVPDLFFRVGYASVYNDTTKAFGTNMIYGDARYDRRIGIANVRVAGSYSSADQQLDSRLAGTRTAVGVIASTEEIAGLPFKPQVNGQLGYYTSDFMSDGNKSQASALKYGAGVVFNDFLIPDSKLGVRYDGYNASNRGYVPVNTGSGTAGYFRDEANNRNTSLNGVYVEGSYKDMVFSYGAYTLSQKDKNTGVEYGSGANDGKAAQGQTFKISYKVTF